MDISDFQQFGSIRSTASNTFYPHFSKIVVTKFIKGIPKAGKYKPQKLSKGNLFAKDVCERNIDKESISLSETSKNFSLREER